MKSIQVTTENEKSILGNSFQQKGIEAEVEELKRQIGEFFPADAASFDLTKTEDVFRLTKELLDRLWRWEK